MCNMLEGLEGVLCLADDVLVYGQNQEEHDKRLYAVFGRMQNAGLTLNKDKCVLGADKVKYLGHAVDQEGIRADPDKTAAIQAMRPPTNISELRRFMGMVNQLGKFSQNLAQISQPLRDLLSVKSAWVWGPAQEESFSSIKAELCQPTVFAFYDPDAEILISADASSYGLRAVLLQKMGHDLKPVSYASQSLLEAETHYAQIEKEALAITWACDYVLGRRFAIETDHKPLVPLLSTKLFDNLPPRVLRFRLRLMRFDFSIHHVPGKLMYTADTLSRAPTSTPHKSAVCLQEDVERLVAVVCSCLPGSEEVIDKYRVAQGQDTTVMTLVSYCSSGWPDKHQLKPEVKPYWQHRGKLTVNKGLLLFGDRIVVPKQLQVHTLEKIHQGHQGIERCRLRALSAVWWPGLTTDIETMVKQCHTCVKQTRHSKEPMIALDSPDYPWQRVGADLFELNRMNYLVVVDYFSCYFEVVKLTSTA